MQKVCKFGQPGTCAFLAFGTAGWLCTKGTDLEKIIRERLEAGTMKATGDNCEGILNVTVPKKD